MKLDWNWAILQHFHTKKLVEILVISTVELLHRFHKVFYGRVYASLSKLVTCYDGSLSNDWSMHDKIFDHIICNGAMKSK